MTKETKKPVTALDKQLAEKTKEAESLKAQLDLSIQQHIKIKNTVQDVASMVLSDPLLQKDSGIRLVLTIISKSV